MIVTQMQTVQTQSEVITACATLDSLEMDLHVLVSKHNMQNYYALYLLLTLLLPDINECVTINGGCEQICTNAIGSFACGCGSGYLLDGNGFNCTGTLSLVSMVLSFAQLLMTYCVLCRYQ